MVSKIAVLLIVISISGVTAVTKQNVLDTGFLQDFMGNIIQEMFDDYKKGEARYGQVEEQLEFFVIDGNISKERWQKATNDLNALRDELEATSTSDSTQASSDAKASTTNFLQNFGQTILDEIMEDVEKGEATYQQAVTQIAVMIGSGTITQKQYDQAVIDLEESDDIYVESKSKA